MSEYAAYSTFQRIYRVVATLYAFQDSPILGVGGDSMFAFVQSANIEYLDDWKFWLDENDRNSIVPHNIILQNFAEHGLFAGLIFIYVIWQCFKISFSRGAPLLLKQLFIVMLLFFLTSYISELYRVFFVGYLALISVINKRQWQK